MAGTARLAAPLHDRLPTDAPWLAILALAGGFQFGRGAWAEGIPFAIGFVALLADTLGRMPRADVTAARPSAPRWGVVVALVVGGCVIAVLPAFDWVAGVLVAMVGLAAVVPTWGRRESGDPAAPFAGTDADAGGRVGTGRGADTGPGADGGAGSDTAGERRALRRAAVLWSAIVVALCLWELTAFFLGLPSAHADWRHPALSDLVKPAVERPLWRGLLFAAWLAAGWGLVRRGWRGDPTNERTATQDQGRGAPARREAGLVPEAPSDPGTPSMPREEPELDSHPGEAGGGT